jgi:hypothetical protein
MIILKILGLLWFAGLLLITLVIVMGIIIEKNFDETHPIKKWWRKHVVAPAPDDIDI